MIVDSRLLHIDSPFSSVGYSAMLTWRKNASRMGYEIVWGRPDSKSNLEVSCISVPLPLPRPRIGGRQGVGRAVLRRLNPLAFNPLPT